VAGHAPDYWKGTAPVEEVFAHMYEFMTGDIRHSEMEIVFSRAFAHFKKIIGRYDPGKICG